MEFGCSRSIVRRTCRWALSSAARCSWRSALQLTWSWSTSCPDRDLFATLAPSLDAVVLLAGSGIGDLGGANVTPEHLVRSLSRRVALPAAGGEGSHFADTAAGALDLPLLAVVGWELLLAADLLHGMPPGSSAQGALAAAADAVLARCVCRCAGTLGERVTGRRGPDQERTGLRGWAGCAGSRSVVAAAITHGRRLPRSRARMGHSWATHGGRRLRRVRARASRPPDRRAGPCRARLGARPLGVEPKRRESVGRMTRVAHPGLAPVRAKRTASSPSAARVGSPCCRRCCCSWGCLPRCFLRDHRGGSNLPQHRRTLRRPMRPVPCATHAAPYVPWLCGVCPD